MIVEDMVPLIEHGSTSFCQQQQQHFIERTIMAVVVSTDERLDKRADANTSALSKGLISLLCAVLCAGRIESAIGCSR